MPFYELVYIARQDLTPIEVDSLTEKYEKILEEKGGKIASREYWGLRNLAYKIKKNSKGHYVLLILDSSPEALFEVERVMSFDENIIRKSVFKIEKLPSKHSDLMVSSKAKDYKSGK